MEPQDGNNGEEIGPIEIPNLSVRQKKGLQKTSPSPFKRTSGNHLDPSVQAVKQDELLRYLMTGYSLRESATLIGVSYGTAHNWAKTPIFQERLRGLSKEIYGRIDEELRGRIFDARKRIEELSEKALDTLESLMDSERDGIAQKAADSVLDRNETTARNKKIESEHKHRFIDPLMLVHAAATAKELEPFIEGETQAEQP